MTQQLKERNLTMLTDFYEITMANGYFKNGVGDKITQFDMFFREVPDNGGFAIMAGVEQLADYLLVDRSALSHSLSVLKRDGIIDYHKNHFKVFVRDLFYCLVRLRCVWRI